MTIYKYKLTYGFEISLKAYMIFAGYVAENITPEMRLKCKKETRHDDDKHVLDFWFSETMQGDDQWCIGYNFVINSMPFVIRGYSHDKKKHETKLVCGVDIGNIDRWAGNIADVTVNHGTVLETFSSHSFLESTSAAAKASALETLTSDPGWKRFLQKHADHDKCMFDTPRYGLIIDEDENKNNRSQLYIVPTVFITTDDCDCCS